MTSGRLVAWAFALPLFATVARAQAPLPLPVLDDKPTPRVDAGGPSAAVTALAFGADGETLYAAGLDKVVRLWVRQQGRFVLKTAFRVPIGPGNAGAINALALSPDGAWLAMAGRAPMRGEAGFRTTGVFADAAARSVDQNQDLGVIYVVRTANPVGGKVLRGHRGEVRALAFAPATPGKPPLLVSAATERDGARLFGGLRLWDVASGKLLAERHDLPKPPAPPGLAVWHTGPKATDVRVAVAWPDEEPAKEGTFRLWDPGANAAPLQSWEANPFCQTAALLGQDDRAHVLVGSLGKNPWAGRLHVWHVSAARNAQVKLSEEAAFLSANQVVFLPVALAAVMPPHGGQPSHAAAILQPSSPDDDFRLALVDLRSHRVVANVPLKGSDKNQLPVLAAHGPYLAVAATRDHAVRVYAVADLLAGKDGPQGVLRGTGVAPRRVAFVDKGRGLWLSEDEQARPLSGGLVFDLAKRAVRANDRADLTADAPELGEWSLTIDQDGKGVQVRQGQRPLPPLRLRGRDEVVTKAALRPPAPQRPGVLAVAYTELEANRAFILLCDPADARPYRRLVGHLQNVRDLAFSGSRPLLASVADDQTVCVWSLADLNQANGQVTGLGVRDGADKTVVVGAVEPGSAAAKAALAEGDVLEKVGAPDAAKSVRNATEFFLAVAARRPGDLVEVTVRGKGAVRLPVGRAVDFRNPLFSLFLLRTAALPDWVGWSPAGPYDSSGPAAEAHLGWHTNTSDPAAPVSYAAARAYRKDYYREGILGDLATAADLGRALQEWKKRHPDPAPAPALRPVRPDGAAATERADEYLVRSPVNALRVGLNDDYALDDKHVLRWRVVRADGKKVSAGAVEISGEAARDGREWQVDLAGVRWERGEYRVRVGLHAHAGGPELASAAVTFRFLPPAPVVALRWNNKALTTTQREPLDVMEDKLALHVVVEAPARQEVEIQFAQLLHGSPKTAPAPRTQIGARAFDQTFTLHEGLNQLTVRAVNKGALAGHEDKETNVATAWVRYKARPELPPRFTALRVEPEPEVRQLGGKKTWVVSRPSVRLTGMIEADGLLDGADWSVADGKRNPIPLTKAAFAIDLSLEASKEPVPVRLWAKSKRSDESYSERWVAFHPPLPDVTFDPLESPDVLVEKVTLTGTVRAATVHRYTLRFRVTSPEGKKREFTPKIDAKAGRWEAELALFPGSNSVEAVVGNEWRGERTVEGALRLNYRRPPRITAFPPQVTAVETNKVKLTAVTVEGPVDRPLTAFKVDGKPVPFKAGKPAVQGGRWVWQVELPEVFVNDGDRNLNQVAVQAVTDEGESPAVVVRVIHQKIPRPPRARFLIPAADDTARRPQYPVTFRVESERPLERVEIRRGEEVLYRADLANVEREGARHVLQATTELTLRPGANRLELVAVNGDGRSPRAEVVVSYTAPAVLIDIDRVELRAEKGEDVEQVFHPVFQAGGVTFPEMPRGLVWLAGRVRWSDPEAKALTDDRLQVVAKVGDCRQFPVALGARGKGEEANVRRFRVPLVLIGANNRIKVEVPGVGQQELSRREFELRCAAPVTKQRLHVLIVGVDVQDAAGLKARVLDALAVEPGNRPVGSQGEFFKKPPFERCVLYHVLAGEVERGNVEGQLLEINREIRRLKDESGWLNDVVLIYYEGEDVEVPARKERWLKTTRNRQIPKARPQDYAIPCHDLPRVPGAQLFLLNVTNTGAAHAAAGDWGGDPDAGLMRYACREPIEPAEVGPAFLNLLREAIRQKGQLGEVVAYLNQLLTQKPRFSPLLALDDDQKSRRFNEPNR